ncbi:inositol monophosphatase [Flavobacteriales bacterium]|jgi:myo-inositol-1(or 4)-monophosphatase|nr:inositol monophosphatase [Flavobacteriales bacterium]
MHLSQILPEVKTLTKSVGDFIRQESRQFESSKIEVKSKNSLVSYVDKQAEEKLVKGLKHIFPEAGFITEEETVEQSEAEFKWVIDPLDGTTNFMHGIPVYAISIALIQNNIPVLGVIYEISRDELFAAVSGKGATLNDNEIQVAQNKTLEDSLNATGFPYYDYSNMSGYLGMLQELMKGSRGIRRMGSAAVDLAYVACGRFDSFFEYSLNAWDVAAGIIIVQEAGGKVVDFKGGEDYLFGREIVASSSLIHDEMMSKIKAHF